MLERFAYTVKMSLQNGEFLGPRRLRKDIEEKMAYGIRQHNLYHYLPSLASELNIPDSFHALKSHNVPEEKLFPGLIRDWKSRNGKDLSSLELLSAIAKVRGMGVVFRNVASSTGCLRSVYANSLREHIGKHWVQLALHLGFNRTTVDDVLVRNKDNLHSQLSEFLEMIAIPDIGNSTMALILVALHAADLLSVEKEVFLESQKRGFLDEHGHVIDSNHSKSEGTAYADLRSSDPSYQEEVRQPSGMSSLFSRADAVGESSVSTGHEPPDTTESLSDTTITNSSLPVTTGENIVTKEPTTASKYLQESLEPTQHILDMETAITALEEKQDEEFIIGLFASDPQQIYTKTKDGRSPLHLAAATGYIVLCSYLQDILGSDMKDYVNSRDKNGMTALMMACEHNQMEVVKKLLEMKADPNIPDNLGRSCLHLMSTARNAEMIRLLCSHDASPHCCDNETRIPPLTVAALFGDLASVTALMEFGANPNHPKSSLLPPILAAAQEGKAHIVQFFLKRGADPSIGNPYGYSALHFAAFRKHYDVVKCILQKDPSSDILTEENATPLMCAAASGSEDIVKVLIESGAQVDAVRTVKTPTGKIQVSPLAEAALSTHFGVVKVLLEHNAYIHHLSGGVHSVLEFACVGGEPEIVQLIVDKFDSYKDISEFEPAIFRAVTEGNFKCAKVIVDKVGLQTLWDAATSTTGKQQLADALCRYSDVLKEQHKHLPNVGNEMVRTVGTTEDIFLQTRTQLLSIPAHVDSIKNTLLFKPLSVVSEEKKLLVDVCLHILHHSGDKAELYTTASEADCANVVTFLNDYSGKETLTEAEASTFLRSIQTGNPSPLQFLATRTNVDSLWDMAESTYKENVAQFFAETQARSQKYNCSAYINVRRVFNESLMIALMKKIKNISQESLGDSNEHCTPFCLAYGNSVCEGGWSESVLEDVPDSASVMENCKQVQSSLHREERHQPVNTIESYQGNTLPETNRENHDSDLNSRYVEEHEIQSLTTDDSLLEPGSLEGDSTIPVPPANTTISGPTVKPSQTLPLEKSSVELWEQPGNNYSSQVIGSFADHYKLLMKIAAKVGSKWSFLARYLGVTEENISAIKLRASSIHERSSQMLKHWISQSPQKATWGRLCNGLVRILRGDIVDDISQYLYGSGRHNILKYAEKSLATSNIQILAFVANQVASSWEPLAKELGVSMHLSPHVTCDEDACIAVLCQWLNTSHRPPLYRQLYNALENIGCGHIIALVEEQLQATAKQ